MLNRERVRRAAVIIGGIVVLVVLMGANANSNVVAAVADTLGFTFIAGLYTTNMKTSSKIDELHNKTDKVIYQTNSDLDRRMKAESDRTIQAVKELLDERNQSTPKPRAMPTTRTRLQNAKRSRQHETDS